MEFFLNHPDIGKASVLLLFDGVPYEADSTHPWWDEIVRLCLDDDGRVVDLFPIRPFQQPAEEIPFNPEVIDRTGEHLSRLYGERGKREHLEAAYGNSGQGDPPFTTRVGGILRPNNDILVDHYENHGYDLERMAKAEGYSIQDANAWIRSDPTLARALLEAFRADEARRQRARTWKPQNVEPRVVITDDDGETD